MAVVEVVIEGRDGISRPNGPELVWSLGAVEVKLGDRCGGSGECQAIRDIVDMIHKGEARMVRILRRGQLGIAVREHGRVQRALEFGRIVLACREIRPFGEQSTKVEADPPGGVTAGALFSPGLFFLLPFQPRRDLM